MEQDFDINTFRPDSVNELAAFLKEEYPEGEISDEKYLSWEYLDNPFGKAIVTSVRNETKKIVSQYALVPTEVRVNGIGRHASLSINTLTAEKYRGNGLFTSTANETYNYCAANEIEFTYGVPNGNSFHGFIRRLKFTHAGNLVFMARPLKPVKVLSTVLKRKRQKKGGSIELIFDSNDLTKNNVSELNFSDDKGLYYDFINTWNEQNIISVQKKFDYLNWRYIDNPSRKYLMFKLESRDGIGAIVVIRTMYLYGMKVCLIMEHLSLSKHASYALLNTISEAARKNNLELMIALAASKKNNQYVQLRSGGFWPVPAFMLPQQLPFITRIHKNSNDLKEKLNDLRNWHFSFGDYDVF